MLLAHHLKKQEGSVIFLLWLVSKEALYGLDKVARLVLRSIHHYISCNFLTLVVMLPDHRSI